MWKNCVSTMKQESLIVRTGLYWSNSRSSRKSSIELYLSFSCLILNPLLIKVGFRYFPSIKVKKIRNALSIFEPSSLKLQMYIQTHLRESRIYRWNCLISLISLRIFVVVVVAFVVDVLIFVVVVVIYITIIVVVFVVVVVVVGKSRNQNFKNLE